MKPASDREIARWTDIYQDWRYAGPTPLHVKAIKKLLFTLKNAFGNIDALNRMLDEKRSVVDELVGTIDSLRASPKRAKLPGRRRCENSSFVFQGVLVDLQTGFYDDDGRLGEVFMTTRRAGSMIDVLCRDTAIVVSIALQYGATLDELAKSATQGDMSVPDGLVTVLAAHLEQLA